MILLQTQVAAGTPGIPDYTIFGAWGVCLLLLSIAVWVLYRDKKTLITDHIEAMDKVIIKHEAQLKDVVTKYELRLQEKDDDLKELNKDVRGMAVDAVSTINKFTEIQNRTITR